RLGFGERIRYSMPPEESLPAGGQGAVGIECRSDDIELQALLLKLNDEDSALRVRAERALNTRLNGGCQVPIACYAERENGQLWLRGLVGDPDGQRLLRAEARGAESDPETLGISVAEDLLAQGAQAILDAVYEEAPAR
ncbi:MAG TPA: hydroxymethylbilane synthase, partial [Pseudomonas sp.]|nr:hydroxymethylbilane synthase [Pseudomonas sp.]